MTRHQLEVADVVREHGDEYLARHGGTAAQRQVLRAIHNCRTAALGGHVEECDQCGHQRVAYNSCRNRHCPKCQGPACARWMQARAAELLPVPYFHLVFTLPNALGPLALQNQRMVYGLLFQAAAQTLLEVAANPRFLGAEIGFLTVLHTWVKTCCTTRMYIASCQGAVYPQSKIAGSPPGPASSCRSAFSAGSFAASSSKG